MHAALPEDSLKFSEDFLRSSLPYNVMVCLVAGVNGFESDCFLWANDPVLLFGSEATPSFSSPAYD